MTRAKKTLALMRLGGSNRLQGVLRGNASVVEREPVVLPDEQKKLRRRHMRLTLEDVFISFAGYTPADHSLHRYISALSHGDRLGTRVVNGRWELLDSAGMVVGRLARSFKPPEGMRCIDATVFAVVLRNREDSNPEYREKLVCEQWESALTPYLTVMRNAWGRFVFRPVWF